jgi:hypothetical protein
LLNIIFSCQAIEQATGSADIDGQLLEAAKLGSMNDVDRLLRIGAEVNAKVILSWSMSCPKS